MLIFNKKMSLKLMQILIVLLICLLIVSAYRINPFLIPRPCKEMTPCVELLECEYFKNILTKTRRPITHRIQKLIQDHFCEMGQEYPKHFRLLPMDICGPISPLADRITNGKMAELEEFPWMVLIAYNSAEGISFNCGGTLITKNIVLTAAHCVENMPIIGVRLGEYDTNNIDRDCVHSYCSPPVQDVYVKESIVHPEYNPVTNQNDIALLKLSVNANFSNSNIKPVCLPVRELNDNILSAIITGWGATEESDISNVPMKASIRVWPIMICQEVYKNHILITNKQICAGGSHGRDSCQGDSGGPLMSLSLIDGIPRYIQYGIVSFGPKKCGSDGQPGIYTKTKSYLKWILDNIGEDIERTNNDNTM
ncbi:hypothetical protein ABEB36_006949 [Hypothenemus hampei]|uniref:limulus clotting factor C n=1 Tax=Hypothenemus hampei TaxID=57062 RepID=A0ABD1ET24_HYPHA